MQGLAMAREKPPAQEQWRAMGKTMRRTMETVHLIANPGFNADRGPVNIFSARLHAEFCGRLVRRI
jgi:hypothetical protein